MAKIKKQELTTEYLIAKIEELTKKQIMIEDAINNYMELYQKITGAIEMLQSIIEENKVNEVKQPETDEKIT